MSIVPRTTADVATVDPRTKALLMTVRRALLMIVKGIEEYLGIEAR